jgi:glycosyltransferase involved in cell wall biosynthesis
VLVSIIIPAYNAAATLRPCLEACLNQSYRDTEVIVADDGSTDETPKIAKSFDRVTYLRQGNAGPAAARNHGARLAKGTIIAYTDADCIPATDWIEQLLLGFTEGAIAVGGTYGIVNEDNLLARLVHYEIIGRHATFSKEVDFLGSFNVAYQKAKFDAVGGFDESFKFASGEDNDLAYRLQDEGGTLHFNRAATVAHHHPENLWPYLRVQAKHGFWRMKVYAKHPARARTGDRYVGFLELIGIPFSLLVLAALPLTILLANLATHPARDTSCYALLLILYYGAHIPLADRLLHGRPIGERILFTALISLRDVARALGMLKDMITFTAHKPGRN